MKKPLPWARLRPELIDDRAVFAQATNRQSLRQAWSRVWKNQGCSGGDGMSIDRFASGLSGRIDKLSRDLKSGDYSPGPLRVVDIAKRRITELR